MWLLVSVNVLCAFLSTILATNPGFRLRITEDGLNYGMFDCLYIYILLCQYSLTVILNAILRYL